MNYAELVAEQRQYFATKSTLSYNFRIEQLKHLLFLINKHEAAILAALNQDLRKSDLEAWGTEFGVVITELKYYISKLKKWMQPQSLRTPIFHFRANSYVKKIPHGNTLIIAPWNYPFLLSIRPLIGAIAAGNTTIVKPSENAPATASVLESIINTNFNKAYLHVVNTNAEGAKNLIQQQFDYIFYTGGGIVGKLIYQAAAKNLTPVTLELGGKNPCVIDATANLDITASRVVWGKFNNSGQTCVAADYILVHESVKKELITKLATRIITFFGKDAQQSADYGRILNDFHFERICKLMANEEIIYGGKTDKSDKYIEPTIIELNNLESPIMQEEIFGPLLPIISYSDINDALKVINQHPTPLVIYLFANNKNLMNKFVDETSSGDLVINETVLHFGNLLMPIGGKGSSGFGKMQGKYTYDAFSHNKSVLHKRFFPDLPIRYPPYTASQLNKLKMLFKYFFQR